MIFNPAARGATSKRLQSLFDKRNDNPHCIELQPTAKPGDATRLAAEAVTNGYRTIVAAGGDGTINEAVNGMGTSGATLGVIPMGTANVFARELNIPLNVTGAWNTIFTGQTRAIDLGVTTTNGTRRYFVQLGGVGFDAHVVQHISLELKKWLGPLSYVWAGLLALQKPFDPVSVSSNGASNPASGIVALVGNGRLYGGPFRVFPEARLDDGKLDVCVFSGGRYMDVMRYLHGVMRGVHIRSRDVHYFQAAEFECCAATTAAGFELDGEWAGQTPVRFGVVPRALRVLAPVRTA